MSVLTVTGTPIPDPTLSYNYSPTTIPIASLPSRTSTASAAPAGIFTRPERKSTFAVTTTTREILPAPARTVTSNHQHSRSISATLFPTPPSRSPATSPPTVPNNSHVRTSSSSHSRQSSTSKTMSMHRQGTTASSTSVPRRSTSGRSVSTNSPTSYVALMRRQKATVWCDRSQSTDPRLAAAQKAARHRAALEVSGVTSAGRTNTLNSGGGVVGKIRHGGVPMAKGYVPVNLNGASVPMRLSANEMIGDEDEGLSQGENSMVHGRSGSGRSSTNSAKYRSGYPRTDGGRFSTTSTPPSEGSPGQSIPEQPETRHSTINKKDYFISDEDRISLGENEDSFGELKDMLGPSSVQQATTQAKKAEDLRRRGSVDERAMSMGTGVRLFVANPDLDDD